MFHCCFHWFIFFRIFLSLAIFFVFSYSLIGPNIISSQRNRKKRCSWLCPSIRGPIYFSDHIDKYHQTWLIVVWFRNFFIVIVVFIYLCLKIRIVNDIFVFVVKFYAAQDNIFTRNFVLDQGQSGPWSRTYDQEHRQLDSRLG